MEDSSDEEEVQAESIPLQPADIDNTRDGVNAQVEQESASDSVSSPTIVRRKVLKRSAVWDYFREDKSRGVSICKITNCKTEIANKFTTNLKDHLSRRHIEEYNIVQEKDVERKKINKTRTVPKYGPHSNEQQEFNKALAFWVGTNCTIPNNVVNHKAFEKVIHTANPMLSVPCRETLLNHIHVIHENLKGIICKKLTSARRIAISADIWSKKGLGSSYLGVLATFFDPAENDKTVILLDVRKIETSTHTAVDISREMDAVVKKFKIPASKIWFTTTDSASNMVCAFRDWSINGEEVEEEYRDGMQQEAETAAPSQAIPAYARYSCFIHSLLLCLKPFDANRNFKEITEKVKAVVAKVTNSIILTGELKKRTGKQLLKFSQARWNIVYLVMQRMIGVKDDLSKILIDLSDPRLIISDSEWEIMQEVLKFLEPFNSYTDMTSKDVKTYFSEATVIIKVLEKHLNSYICEEGRFKGVAEQILADLKRRFLCYSISQNENSFRITRRPLKLYLAATLIDPRNCQHLDTEEENIAKECIRALGSDGSEVRNDEENIDPLPLRPRKRKYNLEPRTARLRRTEESRPRSTLEREINTYLDDRYGLEFGNVNSQSNPLEFWIQHSHAYPILAPLALDLLSLPLSTAPLERSFSYCGIATLGRRNGLEGENLAMEITLSRNIKLLDKIMSDTISLEPPDPHLVVSL